MNVFTFDSTDITEDEGLEENDGTKGCAIVLYPESCNSSINYILQ